MLYVNKKLFSALFAVGLGTVIFTVLILYSISLSTQVDNLQALSQNHAKIINVAAQSELLNSNPASSETVKERAFQQLKSAHFEDIGFGETGEFVIGELVENRIEFIIPSRVLGGDIPSVDMNSEEAAPMRRALLGASGYMEALDYQGKQVLAWYEPLPELGAGFVAKIDLGELRKPYFNALYISSGIIFLFSLLITYLFGRIIANRSGISKFVYIEKNKNLFVTFTVIVCLTVVGFVSVGSVIQILYLPEIEKHKIALTSLSTGLASLINSIADSDAQSTLDPNSLSSADNTIAQIKRAARTQPGFGETGEIVFGVMNGQNMEFLFPSRFTGTEPPPVPLEGNNAEPMRRALSNMTGVIEDLDYRGENVTAAFSPVQSLNAGLIAKMDTAELNRPYFMVGIISASIMIFMIVLGTLLAPQYVKELVEFDRTSDNTKLISRNENRSFNFIHNYFSYLVVVFSGLIFLLDYFLPLGIAAGIPYIVLIVIGSFFTDEKGILRLSFLTSILILLGMVLSSSEYAIFWMAFTNRVYAIFTIWLAAIILIKNKKAQEIIRNNQTLLFDLIESAPEATIVSSSEGKIIFANRQAEKLFDYTKKQFNEITIEALVDKKLERSHVKLREKFFQAAYIREMGVGSKLEAVKRSGETFPVEISLSPVATSKEAIVVSSIRDITERLNVQDELKQSIIQAEKANMAKSEFLASMSHELRTPLNAILGFAQLLQHNPGDKPISKQKEYADHIFESGEHLLSLINEILDLAKIESEKFEFIIEEVDAARIIETCVNMIEPLGHTRHIEIINSTENIVLNTDEQRLKQVIINLLSNAIKYNNDGGKVIIENKIKGDFMHLSVTDNGIGISKEENSNVFQLFHRIKSNSYLAREGTGMGLVICKLIVEQLGGQIGFESEEGKGSAFWFELPLLENSQIKLL